MTLESCEKLTGLYTFSNRGEDAGLEVAPHLLKGQLEDRSPNNVKSMCEYHCSGG